MNFLRILLDLVRGALIGVVEIIPGVSGGTVALIVGIYERLIESLSEFLRGIARFVVDVLRGRGLAAAGAHFGRVDWRLVIPVVIGMGIALLTAARVVAPLVDEHPVEARALFAGLIIVALFVPARMVGWPWRAHEWALAVVAAVAGFVISGLPPASSDAPALPLVAVAGAFAVCALVLPGLSGSFVLLVIGVYEPTLAALNDRDYGYLAVFMLGMVIGLAVFVQVLRWLLRRHHRITLAIMTGLMAGSLRALWPWQGGDRELLAPSGEVLPVALWFLLGAVIVVTMLIAGRVIERRAGARIDSRGSASTRRGS
ncbi:DUF368 domain-containing protein [Pseudoclavibacter endophyticus]|uniref:DUF368 domain-containing protein n=1 Tax=Pseudoclavibacter endophyticus TaxID=1778590 RepID=UPI0019AB5F7A|nr:DUF368 domain-containing protein [Pseudoclavibacter endophyticus]GGA58387.1 DUF368 domain-containing protein [Pseudoclavibacter endophyticus]